MPGGLTAFSFSSSLRFHWRKQRCCVQECSPTAGVCEKWADLTFFCQLFSLLFCYWRNLEHFSQSGTQTWDFMWHFFPQDMSWNPSVFIQSLCTWWLVCVFFFLNHAKWIPFKDLAFRMEESINNVKYYCEHLLWLLRILQAALLFKWFAVSRPCWCCPSKSDICLRSRLCFCLQPRNHNHGSFYYNGGKNGCLSGNYCTTRRPCFHSLF